MTKVQISDRRVRAVLLLFAGLMIPAAAFAQGAPPSSPDSTAVAPRAIHADTTAAPAPAAPAPGAAVDFAAMCSSGERNAREGYQVLGWGIAGATTGPIGLGIAMWKQPSVAAVHTAGMTPEAAREYSRCFRREARHRSIRAAMNGMAIGVFAYVTAFYLVDAKTAP